MRLPNIDTLSNYFDRLITENIKLFFFRKEGDGQKVIHQELIINEIKKRISELIQESISTQSYEYLEERRTFNESAIIEELEELIQNDINIGESDRARLEETKKLVPNVERMIVNEKRLRKANEGRARNKNAIDAQFKDIINETKQHN
jgi:hypothetical protein